MVVPASSRSSEFAESIRRRRRTRRRAAPSEEASWFVEPVGDGASSDALPVPDLLQRDPLPWRSLRGALQLVRFAFEGGDCGGLFDILTQATPLADTRWHADAYASQLFLEDLVRTCFEVKVDGVRFDICRPLLVKTLSLPPSRLQDIEARQEVLAELHAEPTIRKQLERVYVAVRGLRTALEPGSREEGGTAPRKLAVLRATRECIDALAEGFTTSRSLLSRLREAGRTMQQSPGYGPLAELLDLDEHMATVDVRLRLGADGRIRGFGVLAIRENAGNARLPGPVRRLWQRIVAFFRGYRYSENEVLVSLLHAVFEPLGDEVMTCLALAGPIEFYLAALSFRRIMEGHGLAASLPEVVEPTDAPAKDAPRRVLEGIFNPLLLLQGVVPTPCDLPRMAGDSLVVLTGPNSGGKTRLLQAVAIVQCLGQAGLFVPAARARIVRAPTLFVSLVGDADPAQVEGRLGAELLRIRRLFEELEPGAMAIVDELCSGTNPDEGETLFEMVVSLLPRLGAQVYVSTHFLALAARLEEQMRGTPLRFLEVELDDDQRPTYAFVPGVAKTSLAQKLAARLGVTQEELERLVARKASRG